MAQRMWPSLWFSTTEMWNWRGRNKMALAASTR